MSTDSLLNVCRSRLQKYAKSGFGEAYHLSNTDEVQKAAVLIPIFVKNGKLSVFLTLRSKNLSSHKGQVAFPGGKQDSGDKDIVATALREAQEEVGIPPEIVEVVAVWEPIYSRGTSKVLLVYPVVGLLKSDFEVTVNRLEVERVFDVPLDFFTSEVNHVYRKVNFKGKEMYLHFYSYESEGVKAPLLIWGLTANLCLRMAVIVLEKLPALKFEDQREIEGLQRYIEWLETKCNGISRL